MIQIMKGNEITYYIKISADVII